MARARRGRGENSIFQRKDNGLWVAEASHGYGDDGKRKKTIAYGTTKAKALANLEKKLKTPNAPAELAKLTVAEYLTKWLKTVKPTVESETYRKYESHVRLHITPHIGAMRLVEVRWQHIEEWYETLADADVSATMRGKVGTTLSTALLAAVARDIIPGNPMQHVAKPKATAEEMTPLTAEQVTTFLEAASKDRLHGLYVTALDTGMRPGELFALAWPDVDFERSSVTVTKSLEWSKGAGLRVKDTKTKSGRRAIQISPFTVDVLHEHRKRMLVEGFAGGPVFCSTSGGWLHLSNVRRHSFKPILERAGLPDVRLYDLRHTCATLLLADGENIKVVSERMGHSSTAITLENYIHVMPGMQQAAAGRMQGILNKKAVGE